MEPWQAGAHRLVKTLININAMNIFACLILGGFLSVIVSVFSEGSITTHGLLFAILIYLATH